MFSTFSLAFVPPTKSVLFLQHGQGGLSSCPPRTACHTLPSSFSWFVQQLPILPRELHFLLPSPPSLSFLVLSSFLFFAFLQLIDLSAPCLILSSIIFFLVNQLIDLSVIAWSPVRCILISIAQLSDPHTSRKPYLTQNFGNWQI